MVWKRSVPKHIGLQELLLDLLAAKKKQLESYTVAKGNDGNQEQAGKREERERETTRQFVPLLVRYSYLLRLFRPWICKRW